MYKATLHVHVMTADHDDSGRHNIFKEVYFKLEKVLIMCPFFRNNGIQPLWGLVSIILQEWTDTHTFSYIQKLDVYKDDPQLSHSL